MQKYETLFLQAERIDTDEAYSERDKIYKSMNFGEIMNIINEIGEIAALVATNTHEFNLNTAEIAAIGSELKSMDKISDCLSTIAQLRRIRSK